MACRIKKRVKLTFSEYTDADINFLSKQSLPHCKELLIIDVLIIIKF